MPPEGAAAPEGFALWRLVVLLSLGGLFEFYDLFLTAYLSPGLEAAGIFHPGRSGLFGWSDQATFGAVTFLGLFVGTVAFARVADRFGRRAVFTTALCWYSVMTGAMALQTTAAGLDLWRFLAGVGIGVELVTIDTYLVELVPARLRGRAFAVNQAIQFLAVPIAAMICAVLVPRQPFGVAGWRWVLLIGSCGAIAVWMIRRDLPESPRWTETRALRGTRADALVTIFRPPLRARTIMLVVFNFFQTVGFYGFGNWVPKLIESSGADVVHSLRYAAAIAVAYPLGPLLCSAIADRFERKWQIVAAATGTACFGLLFLRQSTALGIIACGALITVSNNLLSFAYHAYQAELYPTALRARAVGFVYSWSRLSTVFTSVMIGIVLDHLGRGGVFALIAASMAIVVVSIGGFGPLTRGQPA